MTPEESQALSEKLMEASMPMLEAMFGGMGFEEEMDEMMDEAMEGERR